MKRVRGKSFAALLSAVAFNVAFFLLREAPTPATVWISYGFLHLALILYLAAQLLPLTLPALSPAFKELDTLGGMYLVLQGAMGVLFLLRGSTPWRVALGLQVAMLLLFLVALFPLFASSAPPPAKRRVKRKRVTVPLPPARDVARRVQALVPIAPDQETAEDLEELFQRLSVMDRTTAPSHPMWREFLSKLSRLEQGIRSRESAESPEELCRALQNLLDEILPEEP